MSKNCRGLKTKEFFKCMEAYKSNSKKVFPKFDSKLDTVITTTGTGSKSAVKNFNYTKASKYNPFGTLFQKTTTRSDGTISAHTMVTKKQN
jgi:hypothetical protein